MYHEKFKILDILAVTTQAHEGIETSSFPCNFDQISVTTQAREGIETIWHVTIWVTFIRNNSSL